MTANSWYRRSFFNYKGNREYTRTGYEAASARFVEEDLDVDCSDRHYMITGSNSGIGLQTALEVAKRGGVIHMVCRNQESAARARSEIITTTGNDKIHLHIVDLAKPRDVILWAQRFAAQHEKLHALIHNAGCMVHERKIDQDGVEHNFAVNTLTPHILTLTFMPILERNEDSRVIMVSSAGLLCVRLDPHDLMHENMNPFNGTLAYSQNKRQQVVMALWYAQRYNKVHFSSMHPGWADTAAVRTSIPQFYEMMKDNLRTPAQGADTVVWLAISKAALKQPSGLFFQDREPVSSHLPLAWTKSTIEEEDFLMTNIQDVYTKIYSRLFNADGTLIPSPDPPASSSTTPAPEPTAEENENTESSEHRKERPPASETEPVTYPLIPPPPPSAEKVTFVKSEVQEVAEIHVPPTSSKLKEDTSGGSKESAPEIKENASAEVEKESKEKAPEIKESAPEIKESAPETKESAPETKENIPETKENAPETKESTPETKENTPETKESTPETKENVPETKESTPETKESTPETKETTPETKENTTEIKESTPESKESTEIKENATETQENASEKPSQEPKPESPSTETKMESTEDANSPPSSNQEKKTDSHDADGSSTPSLDRLPEP